MFAQRERKWLVWVLAGLVLFSVAAKPADVGITQAPLGGMVFLDANRNGALDEGELGIGDVNMTANCNNETVVDFYSEPRTVDRYGNTFATGTFGPVLTECDWVVTLEVPEGYVATTETEQVITMLGPDRGSAKVYFGLYKGGTLPHTGMREDAFLPVAAGVLGVMLLVAVGLGLAARAKRRR